jgi:hypothetical protein
LSLRRSVAALRCLSSLRHLCKPGSRCCIGERPGLSCAGSIVHDRLHLPSEMGFGGRNRANQAVRPSPLYLYSNSFFDV